MINRFIKFLSSMKFVVLLLLIFAFSIGYATFVEDDFGTDSAKALIYNTQWFEILLMILGVSLILNMIKHKLFRKEKLPILAFHLSFILILIGAGITRYISYEGMMSVSEGQSQNTFISNDVFLQIKVNDKENQFLLDKKLDLSGITKRCDKTPILKYLKLPFLSSNYFSVSNSDLKQNFSITYSDFLTNIKDSVISQEISGIRLSSSSNSEKKGTELSVNEFTNKNILFKEKIKFKNVNFTVNNIQDSSVNFTIEDDRVSCVSDYNISVTNMPPTGDPPLIFKHGTVFDVNKMSLLTINGNKYMFSDFSYSEEKRLFSMSNNMSSVNNPNRTIDALILKIKVGNEIKKVDLTGRKGIYPNNTKFSIGDLEFNLTYGPKFYTTPFSIFLKDFQLETYPGSMNPASFASEVEVIDGSIRFPYRIYMNNILNYKGYRFFQSSYEPDESGTVLSVNHDWWGSFITYIGYTLMILGMISVFFFKKTRFNSLSDKMNKLKKSTLILFFSLFSFSGFSQSDVNYLDSIEKYKINEHHSEIFEGLLIQHDGRIKPMSTFSSEIIRKLSIKENIYNQSSSQVLLGVLCFPELWENIPLVKVQNKQLLEELNSKNDLVSFKSFFNSENGAYLFDKKLNVSFNKSENKKSKYDKELTEVTERLHILKSLLYTDIHNSLLTIFPNLDSSNHKWSTELNIPHEIADTIIFTNMLNYYLLSVKSSYHDTNWEFADTVLHITKKYQIDKGGELIPKKWKIDLEILYNKLDIFHQLFLLYFFSGLISLILLFFQMFYEKKWINNSIKFIKWVIISGILIHTIGLISRWIISDHAPWTNGYEAMIYTVWATMIAGFIFSKKSDLTLSATTLVSSILLLFAFISYLDPTITNVVPVLNSYWLMIHVSVIVSSYGFLIMGGFLGLLCLMLMIFRSKKNKQIINLKISELTIINEKTLIIGLFMLTIGTFLGGIWANESWGRYWGWDAKETWALVSILVYAFILHMRFVPGLKGKYTFNLTSVIGVYSVLMTYFGVNYLLSGLHSYAAGEKVPIPMSVWISVLIVIIIAILAKLNNNKK